MSEPVQHIAHCSSCGCKMDISEMAPYTNVVCPDCGHHTRVKCELGHYLLTNRYAVGGMSMVFSARDTTLEREVAIKVLNEDYSKDAKRMEEFEREAKITAALSHPHIVRVFTVGKTMDHYYIAMEMVSGENLEQKISKSGAIGEEEMLPIALEIIAGLRAAKAAGVIHRDMKPGNILFDEAGNVKIVDFGLALVTMGGTAQAEEIWATPYYVPPEALDGVEEDFRSDIYALGATLYHALSGKPPLSPDVKSTREVRKAKESIAPLAEVAPWLNPATCRMVDQAMALKPDDRFASYAEMEDAWSAAFHMMRGGGAEEPIHSKGRLRRRVNSNSGVVSLIVAAVVTLVLVAVAVSFFLNPGDSSTGTTVDSVSDSSALSDAGIGLLNTDQGDGSYDPEVAARIGRLFRVSHASMKRHKFDESQGHFQALIRDPDVREPLSTWTRVESLIVAWLKGDPKEYDQSMKTLSQHLKSTHDQQPPQMLELGRQLESPKVVMSYEGGDEPMAVVELMSVALKNWELGAWDKAVPLFSRAATHALPTGSPLMVYRELAQRYLSDYKKLKPWGNMAKPESTREARTRLAQLKRCLGELKTRGRARFHVRVWQFRLLRQIKQLEAKPVDVAHTSQKPSFEEVLPKFKQKLAEGAFAQASELLQTIDFKNTPAGKKELCDAWIYLADSSSVFLAGLEEAVPAEGVAINMQVAEDGGGLQAYTKVLSAASGGLTFQGEGGKKVFAKWQKVSPDSVISLFQQLLKPSLSSPEGQMQTEQAICYAWLSGMEDKARLAAGKLSEVNESYNKRWAKTVNSLDLNQ